MFKIIVMFGLFSSTLYRTLTNASYVENNSQIRKFYPIVSGTVCKILLCVIILYHEETIW